MQRRTRIRISAALAVALIGTSAGARAQDDTEPVTPIEGLDGTIDDGTYVGTMALSGRFIHEIDLGSSTWRGAFTGPATLVIENGSASGTWSMDGPASVHGQYSQAGASVTMNGDQSVTSSGTFVGSGGAYRATGTVNTTGSVTAGVTGVGEQTQTMNETSAADMPLQHLLFTCDQLQVTFDYNLEQNVQAQGFSGEIQGSLTLLREPYTEGIPEQLVELAVEAHDAKDRLDASTLLSGEEQTSVRDLWALLDAAAALAEQIDETPCPPDPDYLEYSSNVILFIASALAQRALDILETAEPGSPEYQAALTEFGTVALTVAATGAGDTPLGQELLAIIHEGFEGFLGAALDELYEGKFDDRGLPTEPLPPLAEWDPAIRHTVATSVGLGQLMGWTYEWRHKVLDPIEMFGEAHA